MGWMKGGNFQQKFKFIKFCLFVAKVTEFDMVFQTRIPFLQLLKI